MADKKRKERDSSSISGGKRKSLPSRSGYTGKPKQKRGGDKITKRVGPQLPNSLRKEINLLDSGTHSNSEDEDVKSDELDELYEYEEEVPEEESKKNRRFDYVENFEYELPEEFEDENVASDEDDVEKEGEDEDGEEDEGRHARMLQGVTGLPIEAFQGKKKKNETVRSEAYTESEYNPSSDVLEGDGHISIQDLLDPLHGKSGFSKLRKGVQRMEKKAVPVHAPLPRVDREKLERKVAYEQSKKVITMWEPLVKKHREAPTLFFEDDKNLGFSTVGAIASEFEPRTEFEKKMASIVGDNTLMEAHQKDGARLLELNKLSVEDVKDHQDRLAKMRSLLFRHELKSKRIKKIKSKTYHRLLKKDKLKAAADGVSMDPEASKELAMKQEMKRAEERMTLKHKNNSKWAKRILKRGLDVQDDGTRAAISEQLHQHALLTRKMNSMKDSSSDEDSSEDDDDDDDLDVTNQDVSTKLLEKAKAKTLKVLEDADDAPKSGVLSLPFMVRGLKKKRDAAEEEAKQAIDDFEASLNQLEEGTSVKVAKPETSSGRRVFGATKKKVEVTTEKSKVDNFYGNSDSEDDLEVRQIPSNEDNNGDKKEVHIDLDLLNEGTEIVQDPLFKDFEDVVKDASSKTSYEVAIFASDTWQKKKNIPKKASKNTEKRVNVQSAAVLPDQEDAEEVDNSSDSESDGQLEDRNLNMSTKPTYKLPSQEELIRQAFAGDDVVMDFEKDKEGMLNEEVPEPEKPVLLPGWGQWTDVQQKKGLPSWMVAEHESAKKKREDVLKKRKDAHLKHVVISERVDKKAEKLQTKTLPFPFTSNEAFEQSIRMPIGPEFNPVTTIGALNRPEIVKKTGMIIKPIKFEEVNTNEKADDHKRKRNEKSDDHKRKSKTSKGNGGAKHPKKLKAKGIKVM
ncbi:uncharacterized protein C57A7.06 [Impatiens glandulifera]|uniref:uncharacterized protein C57A7.06 n=1 Tax=Impatiens glandulifera TaxID=253017 RepID=UPI001FB0F22A|nr:uncharacterized protein C57A7.06 [Impatiens glandulifera]